MHLVLDEGAEFDRLLAEFQSKRAQFNKLIAECEEKGDYLMGCHWSHEKSKLVPPERKKVWAATREHNQQVEAAALRLEQEQQEPSDEEQEVRERQIEEARRQIAVKDETWRREKGMSPYRPGSARIAAAKEAPVAHRIVPRSPLPWHTWWGDECTGAGRCVCMACHKRRMEKRPSSARSAPTSDDAPRQRRPGWVVVEDPASMETPERRRPRQLCIGQRHLRSLGFGQRDAVVRGRDEGDTGRWCVSAPPTSAPIVTPWGGITVPPSGERRRVEKSVAAKLQAERQKASAAATHRALLHNLPRDGRVSSLPPEQVWRVFLPPHVVEPPKSSMQARRL